MSKSLSILGVLLLWAVSAYAQVTTADVVGTVHDPSGAVVANAKVEITNKGTGLTRTAETGSSGDFVINLLPPGTYLVKVEAPSFKTYTIQSLTLASGDRTRVDANMQPGQASETVEVTAATPLLQTDSSTLQSTVTAQAVQDLPLNGRNFVQLAQSVPGANQGPGNGLTSGNRPDDRRQSSAVSVNGQTEVINNEMIDGMDNNERIIGGLGVRPSVDAIAEFTVQTNDYTAEVGRTAGGVINVITKSGSNKFHGSLYEYFRNDKFDAHSFFDKAGSAKPELRQNQFGGSVGGPIIKDKTFFFFDYEGFRQVSGQAAQVLPVPTLFEEQNPGNFTDRPTAGLPTIVPTIDPIGLDYFKMYPAPNDGPASFITPNLNKTQNSTTYDARVDHKFNDHNLFFARYTYNNVTSFIPGGLPITTVNGVTVNPNGLFFAFAGNAPDKAQQLQVDYTHIFNSNLLLELKAGYLRTNNGSFPLNFGTNVATKLGMPGVDVDALDSGLSQVTFDDNSAAVLGDDQFVPISDIDNTYQYGGVVTYTRGRQSIKIGSTLIRRLATEGQSNSGVGTWAMPTLESLLIGTSRQTTRNNELNVPHYRFWEPSVFVQDDWRVKNWLTLNLGLRYEVYTPLEEEKNRIANFNPATGTIIPAGVNGVSRGGGITTQYNNFAPRIGFAATVAPGTVIRGGYGISYVPLNYTSNVTQKNPPFISVFVYNGTRSLSQGLQPPTPASATAPPSIPDAVALNFKNTAIQQFNLNVQKDFHGNVLTVGYVGVLGRHVATTIGDLDSPPLGPATTACLQLVGAAAQSACLAPLRPFNATLPNFTGDIGEYFTSGTSSYHALQASLERRLQSGLTFNVNYTWAHSIDDVTGLSNENGDGATVLPNNLQLDKGNSDLDLRQRIVASADYAVPLGNTLNGFQGAALKGWSVNFIEVWETGSPFSIVNANPGLSGAHFFGGNTDRPNQISDPLSNVPAGLLFNPAAFAPQPVGTIGDVRKNSLFGPHFQHFDFSIFKNFKVTEGSSLQFRAEFFNLFNQASFGNPGVNNGNNNITSTTFGQISTVSTNYTPRQIQFVLKFLF